jgi:hypothetical protein
MYLQSKESSWNKYNSVFPVTSMPTNPVTVSTMLTEGFAGMDWTCYSKQASLEVGGQVL